MSNEPVLTICRTEMREVSRESWDERFCFICRTRRDFEWVVMETVEPSYYEPSHRVQCGTCHTTDGDCFPGRSREWG